MSQAKPKRDGLYSLRPGTVEKIEVGAEVGDSFDEEENTEVTQLYDELDRRMTQSAKRLSDVAKVAEQKVRAAFSVPAPKRA